MKKKLLLLGVSMMVLAGCSSDSEAANGESEEGMGTLSDESEEGTEAESENATNNESESTDDSNEEPSHESGLLDLSDTEEGWLNFKGEVGSNAEYRITPAIEYNPNSDYEINNGAYVTYYNGDEFIKTVLHDEAGVIEQVDDADSIRLSFHNSFLDRISLTEQ